MAVPSLPCNLVATPGAGFCITMPGGAKLCTSWLSSTPPSLDALMRQFLASLSTALAPLAPIFTIVDVVAEVINMIKALATLNPKEIAEALPALLKKAVALLAILPLAAVPLMILGILDAIIFFIDGYVIYLQQCLRQIAALDEAAAYAASASGVTALIDAVACGRQQFSEFLAASSQGMEPINSLLRAVSGFMEVIGLGQYTIPPFGAVTEAGIGPVVETLAEIVQYIKVIRNAIPL